MNALNIMCWRGGGRSFTKTMWLLNLVIILFSASALSAEFPSLNKCCPNKLNLVQVAVVFNESTEYSYDCLDESVKKLYNISNRESPLVLPENIRTEYGFPQECDLELLPVAEPEVPLTTEAIACYERLVEGVTNGTSKNMIPKTVQLKCIEIDVIPDSKVRIEKITKCCPKGQSYDMEYHICRDIEENNDDEWLVKRLQKNNGSLFEIDTRLHCKISEYAVELTEGKFHFDLDEGILNVSGEGFSGSHAYGEWCVDRQYSTEVLIARVCTKNCSQYGAYCLRKCCPVGEHYKPIHCGSLRSRCVPNTEDEVFFNISDYLDPLRNRYPDFEGVLGIYTGLHCPAGKAALNRSAIQDRHQLTRAGFLEYAGTSTAEYCVDTFDTRECVGDFTLSAVICYSQPVSLEKDYRVSFVLICISCVCLALTLVVYLALPELRNQHGRTLICHLITMLLAFSCLARVQHGLVEDPLMCTLLGYGIYFGFVAAFAWLNVMCFDIWWTFGSVRSTRPLRKANAERRRFLWYSLYAWSFAILLTLTTFLLDIYPVSPILQAKIGKGICWFGSLQNGSTDWPHYIFFVIPMGIVTGTNFVLWVLTARHCARVKSEVHRLQAGSVGDREKRRFRINQAKYVLTGKLWVVMGAGWVSELLSTLVSEPRWLWNIIDLLNELQGVFILIILIFKPKLYYLLLKRLGLAKPDAQKNGTTSSGRTSSTFLSRTISSDERTTLRISLPNNSKQK